MPVESSVMTDSTGTSKITHVGTGVKVKDGGISLDNSTPVSGVLTGATITAPAITNPVVTWSGTKRGVKVYALSVGGTALHAGVLSFVAPAALVVQRVFLDVTTKSSAASTVNVGNTAVNATTLSDTLLDGIDSGTGTGCWDNLISYGTNGKASQRVGAGEWVTIGEASGNVAGLVATLYVEYVEL